MDTVSQVSNLNRTSQSAGWAIQTQNLTKNYGQSRGVNDLNLEVREGEVFGFLGPNGAGKTTTIRILLNLIKPTAGRVMVLGLDSQRDSVEIRKHIGYLPGEFSLYPNLTGAKTLEYFGNLRGGVDWSRVNRLAERLELDLSKKFRQYSRGNKQKVGIIQAMMHRPRLLVLDEPTSGLDPLNQQEFYRLVEEVRQDGSTVFFSSHIISEVEKICDRVAIIREGQLVKVGNVAELTGLKSHHLELIFAGAAPVEDLRQLPGIRDLSIVEEDGPDGRTVIRCVVGAETLDKVVKLAASYTLLNFVSREPSLEESFLHYYK
ncbi:MAG: ybhF 4 [Chloroflexi bacterium]|jgi:ABC-2 type transport system ATP-binding protein|nr:ybhF 4 [Chloroflexota bacterium]